MPSTVSRRLTPAALFAAVLTALTQSLATARPDPLDPTAIAPPMAYESSLRQYRRFADEKSIAWRDANDTVTRIGGWRTYAREAQQSDAAPAAKPAQAAKPPETARPASPGDRKTP